MVREGEAGTAGREDSLGSQPQQLLLLWTALEKLAPGVDPKGP